MREIVHERAIDLIGRDGRRYGWARVYADQQPGGTWAGWIEFVSPETGRTIRTYRETTQSHLDGVAYWATGLEPVYFEGALTRAERVHGDTPDLSGGLSRQSGRVAQLQVESLDAGIPMRVMGVRTLVPGMRRRIRDAGVVTYEGTLRAAADERPGLYSFAIEFGTPNTAALLANTLWSELRSASRVVVDGEDVPLNHAALKAALLGIAA
jgi:hypothetical protein